MLTQKMDEWKGRGRLVGSGGQVDVDYSVQVYRDPLRDGSGLSEQLRYEGIVRVDEPTALWTAFLDTSGGFVLECDDGTRIPCDISPDAGGRSATIAVNGKVERASR